MRGIGMKLKRLLLPLYLIAATQLASSQIVFAMGSNSEDGQSEKAANPDFSMGKKHIDTKNWTDAIQSFSKVVMKNPSNADAFNYLGYANRQLGQYDEAFVHYNKALKINPNHKGANEYIGEAYLKIGNLAKAEEHLARLDDICTFGCAEYTMLKRAVSDHKNGTN
jgi:Flp pilus assembly protein TadD